jgi:hypothetical protein
MSKNIRNRMIWQNYQKLEKNQIEDSYDIHPNQLQNSKIFANRYDYIKSLPDNIRYLEVGVAWGGYSKELVSQKNTQCIHLLDTYNQDHVCWGQRFNNICSCNEPHDSYTSETHEQYIKDLFSKYDNVLTIKGDSRDILPKLNYKYDYIYIDSDNDREVVTPALFDASKLIDVNGIIGLNDYVIWDGIIEERAYGVVQAVNEFLNYNKNWIVDAIALHNLGFYDIYLKRIG